jgi:hypothetical protein
MAQPSPVIPSDLQELSARFEDWRRTRRGKLPIPEPLWAAAAELARSHGVCRTAQVLRLEYKKLMRLAEGEAVRAQVRRSRAPVAGTFFLPRCTSSSTCFHSTCAGNAFQVPRRRCGCSGRIASRVAHARCGLLVDFQFHLYNRPVSLFLLCHKLYAQATT